MIKNSRQPAEAIKTAEWVSLTQRYSVQVMPIWISHCTSRMFPAVLRGERRGNKSIHQRKRLPRYSRAGVRAPLTDRMAAVRQSPASSSMGISQVRR